MPVHHRCRHGSGGRVDEVDGVKRHSLVVLADVPPAHGEALVLVLHTGEGRQGSEHRASHTGEGRQGSEHRARHAGEGRRRSEHRERYTGEGTQRTHTQRRADKGVSTEPVTHGRKDRTGHTGK